VTYISDIQNFAFFIRIVLINMSHGEKDVSRRTRVRLRDSFPEWEGFRWRRGEEVRYLSAVGTWSGLPINSVAQRVKGGFTVRSVPWQESGRVLSVLGSAERRRKVGEGITGRAREIEGS